MFNKAQFDIKTAKPRLNKEAKPNRRCISEKKPPEQKTQRG